MVTCKVILKNGLTITYKGDESSIKDSVNSLPLHDIASISWKY